MGGALIFGLAGIGIGQQSYKTYSEHQPFLRCLAQGAAIGLFVAAVGGVPFVVVVGCVFFIGGVAVGAIGGGIQGAIDLGLSGAAVGLKVIGIWVGLVLTCGVLAILAFWILGWSARLCTLIVKRRLE